MNGAEDDFAYIYLEFNEKLTPSIFEKELFLRVANLHEPNILVQVNNLVFKGTYDECVGTNLFFEEIEDPPVKRNIYDKETAIRLKHVLKQTKLIRLKQMKLPKKVLSANPNVESLRLNLNESYGAVLEKLEQGMLNIEDLAEKATTTAVQEKVQVQEEILAEPQKEVETNINLVEDKTPIALLEAKYEKLKRLARRPVKRMKSPELVFECEEQYEDAYRYHNLERQVLQSSDAFDSVSGPVIEKTFAGGVDIDRCILQGIIPSSPDLNRILTEAELDKVLTIANLENLSIPARYLVFKESLSKIEQLLATASADELQELNEDGQTVEDICNMFKKLVDALRRHMSQVYKPANASLKTEGFDRDRAGVEYVKYKYVPSEELIISSDILNEDHVVIKSESSCNSNSKKLSVSGSRSTSENSDEDEDK